MIRVALAHPGNFQFITFFDQMRVFEHVGCGVMPHLKELMVF